MSSQMSVSVLRSRLEELDLPSHGRKPDLQRRLRKALARIKAEEERIECGGLEEEDVDLHTWTPKFTHYLVVDVEATCDEGRFAGFGYPNEIIELPVVLLHLPPSDGLNVEPCIIDTFHTFVKPVFQPILTPFCKTLTGITQAQVDSAPTFPEALSLLYDFLCKHDLLQVDAIVPTASCTSDPNSSYQPFLDPFSPQHRASLKRTAIFCSHGPFDIRDFIPKSCWINSFPYGPPVWFRRCSILDVRKATIGLLYVDKVDQRGGEAGRLASMAKNRCEEIALPPDDCDTEGQSSTSRSWKVEQRSKRIDTTIPGLLLLMHLKPFEGQLHSGLDDTRNLARVVAELVRRVIAGARSWNDEDRWDEPVEEPTTEASGEEEVLQETTEQHVIDGLARVVLEVAIPSLATAGPISPTDDAASPSVPSRGFPPRKGRPLPVPTPLAPHLRDQILAHNVYLPEYPHPPPLASAPAPATVKRVVVSGESTSIAHLSSSPPAHGAPSTSLPATQTTFPPQRTIPITQYLWSEGPSTPPSKSGLPKGGSIYYPKRWTWMGKKEGQVKWTLSDSQGRCDASTGEEKQS